MVSQGNREVKDVENEELQEKLECLRIQQQRTGGRKRWMKGKLTVWAVENVGKKRPLRKDETEK